MLWATSPACTELETHVLDWLADALALPEAFTSRGAGGGVIQDTASSATLCALLAARDRVTDGAATERGVPAGLTAYASSQAHSSVEKAVASRARSEPPATRGRGRDVAMRGRA
jgi:aromatic-L-amino-acid decarboxylase